MKKILLAAVALVSACAAPTAPVRHVQPSAVSHKDVSCPTYDADGRFLGYMITSGDKCPAQ